MRIRFRKPSRDEVEWLRGDVRFGAWAYGPICTIAFIGVGISEGSTAWIIVGLVCPFVSLALLHFTRRR